MLDPDDLVEDAGALLELPLVCAHLPDCVRVRALERGHDLLGVKRVVAGERLASS
jgi:hypothetical protein